MTRPLPFGFEFSELEPAAALSPAAVATLVRRAAAPRQERSVMRLPDAVAVQRGRLNLPGAWAVTCRRAGRLSGCAIGFPGRVGGTGAVMAASAHLGTLAVVPELWRRGIGTELLTRAVRGLARRAVHLLDVYVDDANAPAHAFYEYCGFRLARAGECLNPPAPERHMAQYVLTLPGAAWRDAS